MKQMIFVLIKLNKPFNEYNFDIYNKHSINDIWVQNVKEIENEKLNFYEAQNITSNSLCCRKYLADFVDKFVEFTE